MSEINHAANNAWIQRMIKLQNKIRQKTVSAADTVWEQIMLNRESLLSDWNRNCPAPPSECEVAIHKRFDQLGRHVGFTIEIRRNENA